MRRPRRSLSGPNSSCPSASPATQAVSVSWTADALVGSARAISGNAGRYMSIDSGPIALTDPRTTIRRAIEGCLADSTGGYSPAMADQQAPELQESLKSRLHHRLALLVLLVDRARH